MQWYRTQQITPKLSVDVRLRRTAAIPVSVSFSSGVFMAFPLEYWGAIGAVSLHGHSPKRLHKLREPRFKFGDRVCVVQEHAW
ncbi:hypothetical protein MRX96_020480 [Rhipicephalus microplus]